MDGTDSGLYTMAGFGISIVEPLGSASNDLISQLQQHTFSNYNFF